MTIKRFNKVCSDTRLHYSVERKDGYWETIMVDYINQSIEEFAKAISRLDLYLNAKVEDIHYNTAYGCIDVTATEA